MRPPSSAASTRARLQLHSSAMTGGYVQQVLNSEGGAPTQRLKLGEDFILAIWLYTYLHSVYKAVYDAFSIHSSVGYVPPHSYHHRPENYSQFPVAPTHQPTNLDQSSHPEYLPSGHQYPPQYVRHYGRPPPTPLQPTNSFPSHQYTGSQIHQPGNICCFTVVFPY